MPPRSLTADRDEQEHASPATSAGRQPDGEQPARELLPADQPPETPTSLHPDIVTLQQAAELILRAGYTGIVSNLVIVEPKEMIATVRLLSELEADAFPAQRTEMLHELQAFTAAVKTVAPQTLWPQIYAEYERILADCAPHARTPRWLRAR